MGGISGYRVAEYRMTPQTRWSLALVPEHEGKAALAAVLGEAPYAFRLKEEGPQPPRRPAPSSRPTATAKPPAPMELPPRPTPPTPPTGEQPRNAV